MKPVVKNLLPDALVSLLLINNSKIENSHRIALLTSVAPENDDLNGEALLTSIEYEKVSSIIRSSDEQNKSDYQKTIAPATLNGYSSTLTKEEIAEKKKDTRCGACKQFGHWWKDDECPMNKNKNKQHKEEARKTSGNVMNIG